MTGLKELPIKKLSDSLASIYGMNYDINYTQFLKFLLLKRFAQPAFVCLDIGIANGIYAIPISSLVKEVHGVDISPAMLEQCRRNLKATKSTNVYLYEGSAAHLPFAPETFDLVFSFSTLLLVSEPDCA